MVLTLRSVSSLKILEKLVTVVDGSEELRSELIEIGRFLDLLVAVIYQVTTLCLF